jgi:hypothetical protein
VTREVYCADAVPWLAERRGTLPAIVTSLPDAAEMPQYAADLPGWAAWFVDAATACLNAVTDDGTCIFYQTDRRNDGRWHSKAGLLLHAAEQAAGLPMRWHRIVLRAPAGCIVMRRPGYAHLAMFARKHGPGAPAPDVIPPSGQVYPNGMPWAAARAAVQAAALAGATTVTDPFCGYGTVLAVAEEYGLAAVGVDIDPAMVALAQALEVQPWQC